MANYIAIAVRGAFLRGIQLFRVLVLSVMGKANENSIMNIVGTVCSLRLKIEKKLSGHGEDYNLPIRQRGKS